MAIRVVIADDSYLIREGLAQLLRGATDIEVIAACADLDQALAAVREHRPDVVVTDIRMPPTHTDEGIRIARDLRAQDPDVGVVVLSQYRDPQHALRLLEEGSGRRAYLLKDRVHDRAELSAVITQVAAGGSFIDPKVVEGLVAARAQAAASPLSELTAREREILAEITEGKSNAAIAESLVLTKRAVEKHINSIFLKLGLSQSEDTSKRVKAALVFLAGQE